MQLKPCAIKSVSQQSAPQAHMTHACVAAPTSRPIPHRAACAGCSNVRRSHKCPVLHALTASIIVILASNSTSESYEQLLAILSGYSVSELRKYMHQHPDDVDMSFLQWLASREDQLHGNAKLKLAVLAGQLLALREGLDPSGFDDVADELQQQWQAPAQSDHQQHQASSQLQHQTQNQEQQQSSNKQTHTATSASDATSSELFPSTTSSLQQSLATGEARHGAALNAFSQANIVRQYEQVRLLNLDVQHARAQSTVQLIGRKQISASDPPQVSGAAQRILEYLLGLSTAELRREVLPEAFRSPESSVTEENYDASSEGSDAETEQLSTTPLQLLQAVDLELGRIKKGSGTDAGDSRLLVPAEDSSIDNVLDALQQLRVDVLAQWDAA